MIILKPCLLCYAGKPWPEVLPPFKGVALVKADDDERGHGLIRRKQFYYSWMPHPDVVNHPDLFRVKVRVLFESVPDDAHAGQKAQVGKYAIEERYLLVDRERKVLEVIGINALGDESTTPNGDPFNNNSTPLADPAGKWQWHETKKGTDLQLKLNADNTVLRETNYANALVIKTGDWSQNCKFNLAQPLAKELIGLAIAPPPADSTDELLAEIVDYFTSPDNMFRPPVNKTKHTVLMHLTYDDITQVDTPMERFGATVTIEFTWKITKEDVVDYVAAPDRDAWEPRFTPPMFEVTNPAAGSAGSPVTSKLSSITLIKKEEGYYARFSMTVSGEFWEPFELRNYPFDVQPLNVVLQTATAMQDTVNFVVTATDLPKIRDTEWAEQTGSATCIFTIDVGKKTRGHYIVKAEADIVRFYSVHMYRVIGVMALFSLGSIASLCAEEGAGTQDRLSTTFTLMLTATAYSLVIAAGLPALGYLTFLDKYILATFGFITTVGAELVVINWVTASHTEFTDVEVANMMEYAAFADLALWVIMHVSLLIYVTFKVIPTERNKIKQTKQTKSPNKGNSAAIDKNTFVAYAPDFDEDSNVRN